jgi:hypothetical protein
VLYNILIKFSISTKLVRLINTCLGETYSGVHTVEDLSHAFPVQKGLKQDV